MLASLPEAERLQLLSSLSESEANSIIWNWEWNGRPKQLLPGSPGSASPRTDWRFWLALAGRGWGKTKVGGETCRKWAEDPTERILMIAPTASDVRDVMIEGPSGLMSCYPPTNRPVYFPTRHLVQFPSGAIGITVSADEPERIRGKQFRKFWFDELAAAQYAQEAWDQVMFGFRLPDAALQGLITTTPKPIDVIKKLVANPRTVVTRGSSDENRSNLSPDFIADVIDPYRGTRLGRQEIDAEILEDVPGALWTRAMIEAARIDWRPAPNHFQRIVVAIDPAVSSNPESDETGIGVVGLCYPEQSKLTGKMVQRAIVLEDLSLRGTPYQWASVAIAALIKWRGDRVVGEINNGGDLVASNIWGVNPNVPFRAVRATRGKMLRAEPASGLYEQGRVQHAGKFPQLEDQMTGWTPQSGQKSPDRLDWLVWALYDLIIQPQEETANLALGHVQDYNISSI